MDMKTKYKMKGVGIEQTIQSVVKIHHDNQEKITKVEDRWNDELPEGTFKNVSILSPTSWLYYYRAWIYWLWSHVAWDTLWWNVCAAPLIWIGDHVVPERSADLFIMKGFEESQQRCRPSFRQRSEFRRGGGKEEMRTRDHVVV